MRKSTSGFSLVEVALALGIVTFGLVAILGLLPVGLNLVKESSDEAIAVNLVGAVTADLQNTDESATQSRRYQVPLSTGNAGSAFFNNEGKWLGNAGPYADAAFAARWTIRSRTDWSPPTAHITIAWPARAGASASGSLEAIMVLTQNPAPAP